MNKTHRTTLASTLLALAAALPMAAQASEANDFDRHFDLPAAAEAAPIAVSPAMVSDGYLPTLAGASGMTSRAEVYAEVLNAIQDGSIGQDGEAGATESVLLAREEANQDQLRAIVALQEIEYQARVAAMRAEEAMRVESEPVATVTEPLAIVETSPEVAAAADEPSTDVAE